ncbi:MAG: NapC/NirT family cytochrome c [Candidatus Binatia bacterium]|jgi:hypothetical protein
MIFPKLVHNRVSYVGATISTLALLVFGFLVILHTTTGAAQAPYAGLLIFVLVPAVLLFGLLLIPVGMLIERRHFTRTGTASILRFPVIDLNDPGYRNATVVFIIGSVFLLFLTVFGSYGVYESTESVTFCGALCHQVMKPEYTTYQHSPHARVRCVDCHVGAGADWYVKSKLSGMYQVYAVTLNKYPRPIPAPIHSLRPAQQTCEQCHWPKQFFGGQQKQLVHFLPDEQNTRWEINLLIKTGGGSPTTGQTEGIHWHMNIANRLEYIATDKQRQHIPWVRMTNLKTGEVAEYVSTDAPLSEEEVSRAQIRTMDCMDCHDRPTHILQSPSYAVNLAMDTGRIDATLPFIKRTAVELLAATYESTEAALGAIDAGVTEFYRDKYPEVLRTRGDAIAHAVAAVQEIYGENFFPRMKARWDIYPDNVGHLVFSGCYRCHDGSHKNAGGKIITKECGACHIILAQGKREQLAYSTEPGGLTFEHPEDIGGAWQEMNCSECHTGVLP